jgi:2-(1,2-epoxy-1,2-dihydrophenyl)acetyl-CoA isomerase
VLTTAFAKVGVSGDYGRTCVLTRPVGSAKSRELYDRPDRVTADEALRLGPTHRVAPAENLAAKTGEIDDRLGLEAIPHGH